MIVDLGSVAFRLVQDVDLFRISKEHLEGTLKKEKERSTEETDHHCADLGVASLHDRAGLLSSDDGCQAQGEPGGGGEHDEGRKE